MAAAAATPLVATRAADTIDPLVITSTDAVSRTVFLGDRRLSITIVSDLTGAATDRLLETLVIEVAEAAAVTVPVITDREARWETAPDIRRPAVGTVRTRRAAAVVTIPLLYRLTITRPPTWTLSSSVEVPAAAVETSAHPTSV